ncbi:MAG TPA: aminomethyl-transferring glycine dehydrogenase subunit GcvPB [Deltaproteobacteria bacterium]|nr:aminomethyl-transferring glycine dehydrogenase subunit GcvPB [Deltaproteobacteria bacterium]
MIFAEPTIFERGAPGRRAYSLPEDEVPHVDPAGEIESALLRREDPLLPEVSELDVIRHFTRLSQWNYSIDTGFYPLGSCTMKYNPKVNEEVARMSGWAKLHPQQPVEDVQGALRLMVELQDFLAAISGMDACTLQPAAGAQGEFVGLLMMRAYLAGQGNARRKILIPDTAHGTNPASSALCGYQVVTLKSGPAGILTPEIVAAAMDEETAGLMITNPNTLGLFETHIAEIAQIVHGKGGLVYCDGANQNALVGMARVGDMGVDVLHFNLHKTFTTPHGGGGPGAGPVAVKKILEPFLPIPVPVRQGEIYAWDSDRPKSIGKVKAFFGNFGMLLRAYTYIREMGAEGLRQVALRAVLNANYVRRSLENDYHLAFPQVCMHECVFSDKLQKKFGVTTADIAKRMMDYGYHPPTIYFPLVVPGALMIEPTETESLQTIDRFIRSMKEIARECREEPDLVKEAPHVPKVRRLDEVKAAKTPRFTYGF